ncbi:unnamed protein product [Auanema sp. JU1783]|nr:unnamed protein product [Auanema sp. JU1783]
MQLLLCFSAVLALALASPVIQEIAPVKSVDAGLLAYAVDLSQPATKSQFTCLQNNGYSVAFIRGYSPVSNGAFDKNACNNIFNAYNAGMGTEVYMTPAPLSSKSGTTQFNEMYTGLVNQGINIRAVWIQVTSPVNWSSNYNTNLNVIASIRSAAFAKGIRVGFYSSAYDWSQITNNYTGYATSGDSLWYWNVNGGGLSGETAPNFSDYYYFGGWAAPSVKQYAQVESVCSITVNRDVYSTSNSNLQQAKVDGKGPVVGNFGF